MSEQRHTAVVRVTHWVTAGCFLALLLTGVEILISHPRFYWGETGNVNVEPLFSFPIPASRGTVPTGYGYVLPDQNGWSRALHFQSAWVVAIAGLVYVLTGLARGHFRKLQPARADLRADVMMAVVTGHLKGEKPGADAPYNVLQRMAYMGAVFVLFPLVMWTGVAMSPGFVAVFPWAVTVWGGTQSARTLHFFVTVALVLFFAVHVAMVMLSGFRAQMRGMISGRAEEEKA